MHKYTYWSCMDLIPTDALTPYPDIQPQTLSVAANVHVEVHVLIQGPMET